MAHLRATENVNRPQKDQKVSFVTIVIQWIDHSHFYFCGFPYQRRGANYLEIGNIRVAPPTLAVLPPTRVPHAKKKVFDSFQVFGAFPMLFGVKNNVVTFVFS